jgi:hypothetical protein
MMAFRNYPPAYTAPKDVAPDGSVSTDDKAILQRWGEYYRSYYVMDVEYFQSRVSSRALDLLHRDFLWARMLSATPHHEPERRDRMADRVTSAADALRPTELGMPLGGGAFAGEVGTAELAELGAFGADDLDRMADRRRGERAVHKGAIGKPRSSAEATKSLVELTSEQARGQITQTTKQSLFAWGTPSSAQSEAAVAQATVSAVTASVGSVATAAAERMREAFSSGDA